MEKSLATLDMAETLSGSACSPLALIQAEIARAPKLASPHTRRTYAGILERFEDWRQGRPVTKTLIEEYAAQLQGEDKAPATINHALSAIRWWARRLADLAMENDHLGEDRQRAIVARAERAAGVENVKGSSPHRGRHIADGEIRALLLACAEDPSPAGVRDGAMIAVAFATGMRRSELAKLTPTDLREIEGGYELTLRRAKGNKTRGVAVYNGAMEYLRDWLALRGAREGPLFLAIRKGGEIQDHGLGGQSLQELLSRRAEAAGVADVHWHDARRTLAGNLLDAGTDLATVQRILGHSSPVTTSAYDRRPEETRRRALRGLHVPYLRRRLL